MQSRISPRSNSCSTVQTGIELTSLEQPRPSCACQQNGRDAVLNPEIAILQTVIGFTEQSPVHSECRPALKVWCASLEGTLASLQVSRAKEKVSRASLEGTRASLQVSRAKEKVSLASLEGTRASLEGTRASLQVSRAKEKVSLATLRARLATLWGSLDGGGAAMKPDFAGFMAVEQSRIMLCGCRERVLEPTAPVRQAPQVPRAARPEACG